MFLCKKKDERPKMRFVEELRLLLAEMKANIPPWCDNPEDCFLYARAEGLAGKLDAITSKFEDFPTLRRVHTSRMVQDRTTYRIFCKDVKKWKKEIEEVLAK